MLGVDGATEEDEGAGLEAEAKCEGASGDPEQAGQAGPDCSTEGNATNWHGRATAKNSSA
jgi:hypothetical protein